jgi:hypothetical protein
LRYFVILIAVVASTLSAEQSTGGAFTIFVEPVESSAIRGRFLMPNSGWVGLSINARYFGGWVLDDPAQPGWYTNMTLGSGNEGFSIFRIQPGAGGAHQNFLAVNNIGHVGIGGGVNNLYPPAILTVRDGKAGMQLRLADDRPIATATGAGIDLVGSSGETLATTVFATVKGLKANATSGNTQGNLVVTVNDGTTAKEIARFHPGGVTFVGDIEGTNIKAKYQDLAEWVPSASDLEPGTVVVLSRDRVNEVSASARSYDTAVAGVVSAEPGVILGEASSSKEMIATTGRVLVKVDASRHPISIGDLLVSSDLRGMAMKSEAVLLGGREMHQPGTIIGKALEPLASGEGQILVLLSLQ